MKSTKLKLFNLEFQRSQSTKEGDTLSNLSKQSHKAHPTPKTIAETIIQLTKKYNHNTSNLENQQDKDHQHTLKMHDYSILRIQYHSTICQKTMSGACMVSFSINLIQLVLYPFMLGDVSMFMAWIVLGIVFDITLTTQSFKYSKLRQPTYKAHKIKSRFKFYAIIGILQIITLVCVLALYSLPMSLRTALTTIQQNVDSRMEACKTILYFRTLVVYELCSVIRSVLSVGCLITSYLYYKESCRRSI